MRGLPWEALDLVHGLEEMVGQNTTESNPYQARGAAIDCRSNVSIGMTVLLELKRRGGDEHGRVGDGGSTAKQVLQRREQAVTTCDDDQKWWEDRQGNGSTSWLCGHER